MTSRVLPVGFGLLLVVSACGSDVKDGSGGGGAGGDSSTSSTSEGGCGVACAEGGGGAGGSGGSGGEAPIGDCIDTTDCDGLGCFELTPGGFRVCEVVVPEATVCDPSGPIEDECCSTSECAEGSCHASTSLPYCGGVELPQFNRCVVDECVSDAECSGNGSGAICAPAGVLGQPARKCVTAFCRTSADCTAEAGGYCAPIDNPCCGQPSGLGCVYPSGCRGDSDCTSGYCDLDYTTGRGTCMPGNPACPA